MRIRTGILLVFALSCGGTAAVGVSELSKRRQNSGPNSVPILVVSKNVARGDVLSKSSVQLQPWPKDMVPDGAVMNMEDIIDRSVVVPLVKGEPLLEMKLASKDAGRGLAAMIPPGMRAFTIRSPDVASGVGGFVMPGNHVDVLLTTISFGVDDPTKGGATTTLLQNVEVLAVAQFLDAPDNNKMNPKEVTSVTMLVTPDQAAKLDLGMNKGKLHLSLRNPKDDVDANTQPATMADLRLHQEKPLDREKFLKSLFGGVADALEKIAAGRPEPAAEEAAAPEPEKLRYATIRTLRGSHRSQIRVEQR